MRRRSPADRTATARAARSTRAFGGRAAAPHRGGLALAPRAARRAGRPAHAAGAVRDAARGDRDVRLRPALPRDEHRRADERDGRRVPGARRRHGDAGRRARPRRARALRLGVQRVHARERDRLGRGRARTPTAPGRCGRTSARSSSFAAGSVLAAVAGTWTLLLAGRALEGLGAGALGVVDVRVGEPRVPAGDVRADARADVVGVGAAVARRARRSPGWSPTTRRWRWVFVLLLPFLPVAVALTLPGLRALARAGARCRAPRRLPQALALAAGHRAVPRARSGSTRRSLLVRAGRRRARAGAAGVARADAGGDAARRARAAVRDRRARAARRRVPRLRRVPAARADRAARLQRRRRPGW